MSKKRDEFEERMDVLATETTKLEARLLRLGAEIALPADISSDDIWIEARQSGLLPALPSAEEQARLGPHPFRLLVR